MAITYFALTSTDPDNCVLDAAAAAKVYGQVRLWTYGTGHTSGSTVLPQDAQTDKWVVVGEDLASGDHAGFRSISTSEKNALVGMVADQFGKRGAALADYGRSLGKGFHLDIAASVSWVGGI